MEKIWKKGSAMPEEPKTPEYDPKDHPWIEMPDEADSLDEALRFSLDEIRIAWWIGPVAAPVFFIRNDATENQKRTVSNGVRAIETVPFGSH